MDLVAGLLIVAAIIFAVLMESSHRTRETTTAALRITAVAATLTIVAVGAYILIA